MHMALGSRIEGLRTDLTLTRRALAQKAGVTEAAIYKIERKGVEPELKTLAKIAAALGITASKLLEDKSQNCS